MRIKVNDGMLEDEINKLARGIGITRAKQVNVGCEYVYVYPKYKHSHRQTSEYEVSMHKVKVVGPISHKTAKIKISPSQTKVVYTKELFLYNYGDELPETATRYDSDLQRANA